MDEIADRVARNRTNAARERISTHEAPFVLSVGSPRSKPSLRAMHVRAGTAFMRTRKLRQNPILPISLSFLRPLAAQAIADTGTDLTLLSY
jgi:hypothetical protein